ncbi:hypothetical protein VTU32_06375 [Thermoanaerobacter sp. CM-CNRG TB177]|jgi:lipid-A-disaccharide synthase-like uncharacterized protein|uniref:Uncharacterized protein n=2 Tax=Caldanaerobacter subterraneus TaxID=911092 RepID=Q8R895_CALS4|nr:MULTISPECIES: hypothetical protein [Thermoanaerobacteraceae]AAM25286.1 hypothetical protein TTE2120 [Caldanaerobacter subterraneus subsp. tengcongensis MB4]MBT1278923.1 hypothetical protein [Thermoanaerobacter sp. CM-CNRG TB177]MCS3915114.1 lipid-A-disaccharide synthase-like uncharacterized protein [Caldanaerobacter subterraneus subsp. tengcongensis MB4]TCO55514.1 hypothetical protein EV203_13920 [Caldanaerobacter subterraneus]
MNNGKKMSGVFFVVTFAIYWLNTISILSLANVKNELINYHIYIAPENNLQSYIGWSAFLLFTNILLTAYAISKESENVLTKIFWYILPTIVILSIAI